MSTTGKNAALPVNGARRDPPCRTAARLRFRRRGRWFRLHQWSPPPPHPVAMAYLTGHLADDRLFGLNLSADFSGLQARARENSVWLDGTLHAIDPDAQISYDPAAPEKAWHITTSDAVVDLEFTPIGVHRGVFEPGVGPQPLPATGRRVPRKRQGRRTDP